MRPNVPQRFGGRLWLDRVAFAQQMVIAHEVTFLPKTTTAVALWETGLSLLQGSGLLEGRYEISGSSKPQEISKVSRTLAKRPAPSFFNVDGKRLSFDYGLARGGTWLYSIRFHEESLLPDLGTLDRWVLAFAAVGEAIYARLYDPVWEQWQNERQLSKFELVGRSTAGLARTWDPDFEEEAVDTTKNPGRIVDRDGYMEALGHEMWLTERFWSLTHAKQEVVRKTLGSRDVDGLIAVQLSERPFKEDNVPAESLRRTLFP